MPSVVCTERIVFVHVKLTNANMFAGKHTTVYGTRVVKIHMGVYFMSEWMTNARNLIGMASIRYYNGSDILPPSLHIHLSIPLPLCSGSIHLSTFAGHRVLEYAYISLKLAILGCCLSISIKQTHYRKIKKLLRFHSTDRETKY